MELYDLAPVIVGVGDVVNRSTRVEDAIEPKQLMLDAILKAVEDTEATGDLQSSIDSLDVVACWTWPYSDLPGLLGEDLKVALKHKHMPNYHGGNQPTKLLDEAAKMISAGHSKVAVICGGEALASLTSCTREKKLPPPGWAKPKQEVQSVFSATNRDRGKNLGTLHRIGAPIQVYPLYENAFRAHHGQSLKINHEQSAKMYANFAEVAEKNPFAWNYGRQAQDFVSISTVRQKNRMICLPYPLLMNAFNTVNLAAACILTSVRYARDLGIPERKWIYPLGGAGTRDSYDFWLRPNYYSSPCISRTLDATLETSGLTKNDIDIYDFYSCFPIVPKLACEHLGISCTSPAKPITLLGGLTSFGGAGNNYSMHALTEMVRQLREERGKNGLILANGGVVTYQHAICLSSSPRRYGPYPQINLLPEVIDDIPVPVIEKEPQGLATIETYTVEFDHTGRPLRGYIVGKLRNGARFLANHGNQTTLNQLASRTDEQVGRHGRVMGDPKVKGRNLFSFMDEARI